MPTQTSSFTLDPVAHDATSRELSYFDQFLVPSEHAATRQLYSLLGSAPAQQQYTAAAQPALGAGAISTNALRSASQQAGLLAGVGQQDSNGVMPERQGPMPLGDIHAAIQHLRANNPAVLDLIRQAFLKQLAANPSVVDPRFAHALAPVSSTTTDLSTNEQVMRWLSLALGAAGAFA